MGPRITYHHVGETHPVVTTVDLAQDAYHWCVWVGLGPFKGQGIAAYEAGRLCGFFRYKFQDGVLVAHGTWVRRRLRSEGIGSRMWELTLAKTKPTQVRVTVASPEGLRLVSSLRGKFKARWKVDVMGAAHLTLNNLGVLPTGGHFDPFREIEVFSTFSTVG